MSDVSGDNSREFVDRALVKDEALMPVILTEAWKAYGDHRKIVSLRNISANVSTNSVYLLGLSDGHEFVAKTSTYGSYVHFRQDHRIIQQWIRRLAPTRYRDFLAGMWTRDDEVFFHRIGDEWIVFYDKTPFYDFLPKILCEAQVVALGEEMASFHRASAQVAPLLGTSWKSLGSDVATLHDHLGSAEWRNERGFSDELEHTLRAECDKFFVNAEKLGYHRMQKIPILMDWNIGNFSVGMNGDGFRLFSRWDYDWFRVEPRTLDF